MTFHDPNYYAKRAEAEQRQAERAGGPEAAKAHEQLAALYRDRAQQPAPQTPLEATRTGLTPA